MVLLLSKWSQLELFTLVERWRGYSEVYAMPLYWHGCKSVLEVILSLWISEILALTNDWQSSTVANFENIAWTEKILKIQWLIALASLGNISSRLHHFPWHYFSIEKLYNNIYICLFVLWCAPHHSYLMANRRKPSGDILHSWLVDVERRIYIAILVIAWYFCGENKYYI